jgi:hypothetical protein
MKGYTRFFEFLANCFQRLYQSISAQRMKKIFYLLSALPGFLWPSPVFATLINIDYVDPWSLKTFRGEAIAGTSGDYWNMVTDYSGEAVLNLKNSQENTTTVSISTQVQMAPNPFNSGSGFSGTTNENLMNSFIFSNDGATRTITFGGLNADSSYALYLYTQGDDLSSGDKLGVSVNGVSYVTDLSDGSASSFIMNQNYLQIDALTDSAGNLVINYWRVAGQANINGIQLSSPVPEPASIVLLGVGSIAVAMAKRRKSLVA